MIRSAQAPRASTSFARAIMRVAAAALALAAASPAAADSLQELRIGGLSFANAGDLVLESQEVWISPVSVSIRYRLSNGAPSPLEVQLVFPLPDIDVGDQDTQFGIHGDPAETLVSPRTLADGAPVTWTTAQRAYQDDRDVTEILRGAALPLLAVGEALERLQVAVASLPPDRRRQLIRENVIHEAGTNSSGRPLYAPNWVVRTSMFAPLRVSAGAPVLLEHSYRPIVGRSQDTILRKALRTNKSLEPIARDRVRTFCVENDLIRGIDRLARDEEANVAGLQEWRISFGLKTATGLTGPAKDFRLVIDKVRPDRLVSFCLKNVQKIKDSQTAFEIRRSGFRPDQDVHVLLIGRGD